MRTRNLLWAIGAMFLGALVTACGGPKLSDDQKTVIEKPNPQYKTGIALQQYCPSDIQPFILGGEVAAPLITGTISASLDRVQALLAAAGKDHQIASSANAPDTYYFRLDEETGRLVKQFGCLVIARGDLDHIAGWDKPGTPDGLLFRLELSIDPAEGVPGYNAVSVRAFDINRFEDRSPQHPTRSYQFALGISTPGVASFSLEPTFSFTDMEAKHYGPNDPKVQQAKHVVYSEIPPGKDAVTAQSTYHDVHQKYIEAASILSSKYVRPTRPPLDALGVYDPYANPLVQAPAKEYCAAAAKSKAAGFSGAETFDLCDYETRQLKRRLDDALQKARAGDEAQSWAKAVCGGMPVAAGNTKPRCPSENSALAATDGTQADGDPVNLTIIYTTVAVTETRPGSQIAAFFADALKAAEPDLVAVAKNELDPAKRAEARSTAADSYDDWRVALIALQNAQDAYDKATSPDEVASTRLALAQAQAAFNKASRKL